MISSARLESPLSDDHCDLLKVLAHTYLQQNLPDKALVLLHAVYAVYPTDVLIRTSLAFAYIRCNKPREALLLLDWHSAGTEFVPEIHLLRSQAFSQMGRMADAAAAMRHFIGARGMAGEQGGG